MGCGALLGVKCCCFVRAKTIMRDCGDVELAHLKKERKKKEKHLARFASTWCSTFATRGVFLVMKTLEDERYLVIKAYSLLSVPSYFFVLAGMHVLRVCRIPTYRVYRLYD